MADERRSMEPPFELHPSFRIPQSRLQATYRSPIVVRSVGVGSVSEDRLHVRHHPRVSQPAQVVRLVAQKELPFVPTGEKAL